MVDVSRPGRAKAVITVDLIGEVGNFVRSDCQATITMLAENVNVSFETVQTFVHERLRIGECARIEFGNDALTSKRNQVQSTAKLFET